MTRPRTLAAVLLAASLALAGCALVPGGSEAPPIDAEAATGETISGDGYSYRVPEGWGVPDSLPPGFSPDTLAADLEDTDGFADNVNVIVPPAGAGAPPAEQIEQAAAPELENSGATDVVVNGRVTVAGAESPHISARYADGDVPYLTEQYYPSSGGRTVVVTFSFSDTVSDADRTAVAESILASWTWD